MNYILEFNNEEIKLPTYSFDILEKMEKADKVFMSENKTQREKLEYLYKLECELIGDDKLKDLVGGDIKSCDPNAIQVIFILIIRAYDKPIDDVNAQETEGTMEQLGQVAEFAEQMNKVPETVGKVNRLKK